MKTTAKAFVIACATLLLSGCGGSDEDSAKRDEEIKRALQEGADKERKMYEGIQQGMEKMERSVQEQTEGKK